jgi:hypothetical protein
LLLLHHGGVIELAAQLATFPLQACQLLKQAWRGARAVICRTHPSEELWPRSADCGVVTLIIYDVRMILSLAFRRR